MKKAYPAAALAVVLWGTAAPVCKLVLDGMSEMALLFYSSLVSFLLLLALNLGRKKTNAARRYTLPDYLHMAALGFLGLFLYNFLYYRGMSLLTAGEACIINYMWPVVIIILSVPVLKEKMTVAKGVGVGISFAGLVLIATQGQFTGFGGMNPFGVLSCLLAAVCYGLFSVLNKRADYDASTLLCVAYLVCVICSGTICLGSGQLAVPTAGQLAGILWNGICVDAAAYVCWCTALNLGDTAKISNLAYFSPFLSLVFGWLLLRERVSLFSFCGLVLIIGGVFVQLTRDRRPSAAQA